MKVLFLIFLLSGVSWAATTTTSTTTTTTTLAVNPPRTGVNQVFRTMAYHPGPDCYELTKNTASDDGIPTEADVRLRDDPEEFVLHHVSVTCTTTMSAP